MKNVTLFGACLTSLGAVLATHYLCKLADERKRRLERKSTKEAIRKWENEGGNVLEPAMPRVTAN